MSDRRPDVTPALWVLRAAWLLLPLTVGPALGAVLDTRSTPVQGVVTVATWGVWAAGLVVLLVPRATSLTALRVGAPGALAVSVWAAGGDVESTSGAIAVGGAAVVLALVLAPPVIDAFVDGSSYGTERRFALRTPPTILALAAATWVAIAAGVATGPLLLASGLWVPGALLTLLGAGVAWTGIRSLHGLARRWLVLVPAGLVVHDPVGRPDSVMAPRPAIERLGPAPADSGALDLTLGATGLALQVQTSAPLPVTVRQGRELTGVETTGILIAVGRPAAVLAEAEARRLPVG